MSKYLRPATPGACVFFTVALADRGSWLLVEKIEFLRQAVDQTRAERPFRIDAWVALPDHLHCVWTLPEGNADFSTRWGAIKGRFLRRLGKGRLRASHKLRREKAIWQRRFWEHHIRDPRDYAAHIRYCLFNPVKHGFVEKPEDWPYSSVHRDIRLKKYTPYGAHFAHHRAVAGCGAVEIGVFRGFEKRDFGTDAIVERMGWCAECAPYGFLRCV